MVIIDLHFLDFYLLRVKSIAVKYIVLHTGPECIILYKKYYFRKSAVLKFFFISFLNSPRDSGVQLLYFTFFQFVLRYDS